MGNPETQFEQAAGRWSRFEDPCGVINASLGDVSRRIAGSEKATVEEKLTQLRRLKKCAQELASLEQEAKAQGEACKNIALGLKSEMNSDEPSEDFKSICAEAFVLVQNRTNNPSSRQSTQMTEVQNLIDRVSGRTQDDVEIALGSNSRQNLKCPILQCPITNPVKNDGCGHVYSLEGVIQFLYQTMKVRTNRLPQALEGVPDHFEAPCPAAQCSGRLRKSSLRRDYQAELTQRQQSALGRRVSSSADDAVDIL